MRDPDHPANRDWERMKTAMTSGLLIPQWRRGLDSLSWEAVKLAIENGIPCDVAFGYPVACKQGEILPNGALSGWLPEDFQEATAAGLAIGRIANLSPDWHCCSTADYEAGALNGAAVRTFNIGRNGFRPGTSTNYASKNNWPALGRATRGVEAFWAWVAFWPNFPSDAEIEELRAIVAAATNDKTKLGGIQYMNNNGLDVDETLLVDPNWRP